MLDETMDVPQEELDAKRRDARQKDHLTEKQDKEDLQAIMGTPQGRRFISRMMGICGIYRTSFTGNATTYFNEGRRDIGLRLLAEVVDTNTELYLTMLREQQKGETV